ncbi:MAG: LysM peptidoglycan-binding domain-containing protein [Candidatus Berkelbacteria bacterium]|nr:LysM peptidoglycan-binding domain-containing protein [Candidatus Berkelbacteria bacterium]MCR4307613.1 LysM peptidoglycan-binding domain-containing protein [Candidatus Berkelbacteria bacterium]
MRVPPALVLVTVLIIGFLLSSSVYFYTKSRPSTKSNSDKSTFSGDLPQLTASESSKKVDELTKPADSKGRLSYPKNVYTVETKETLFGIGTKFGIDWKLIKLANGITNENLIQTGYTLVIPRVEPTTDMYRVNFKIDEDKASALNRDLHDKSSDPLFNPLEVAKKDAVPYFGLTAEDEFTLLEQDESSGTALVQAKNTNASTVVGLYQPKEKGKKGFWAVLYVELRN